MSEYKDKHPCMENCCDKPDIVEFHGVYRCRECEEACGCFMEDDS